MKKAAKLFAQKYSCGSSLTGPDEIVIQGDVLDDLLEFIPEKWPEVQYSQTNKQTNKQTNIYACARMGISSHSLVPQENASQCNH